MEIKEQLPDTSVTDSSKTTSKKQSVSALPEQSDNPVATDKIEVVLIATHEHGGELKQPGDSIHVNQRQHEWLRTHGKVE